jgi:hypothetical protein
MIDFPIPTNVGETFSAGGKTWVWNGYAWDAVPQIPSTVATFKITGEAEFGIPVETKATPSISDGTLTLNLTEATLFYVTINASANVVFLNPPQSPKVFSFNLQTVGNGTSYLVNWPISVKWANGITPIITTTNGKSDIYSFITHDGGLNWYGFISGQNF